MLFRTAVLLAAAAVATAQVEQGGAPRAAGAKTFLAAPARIDLSAQAPDVAKLLSEDAVGQKVKKEKPLRIGALLEVSAGLDAFSTAKVSGGVVHRLAITSPNALGMGINFKTYQMPAGAALFIYSEQQPGTVRGSFTAANHKLYGGLSVMPVVGDTVVVEVFAPDGVSAPVVEVESVVHHYKNTMFRTNADRAREAAAKAALPMDGKSKVEQPQCFGCSGDCNVNAACPLGDDWRPESSGIVRILTSGGSSLCMGSMINNVEQDGRQLFLSADHCGGGNADSWILMFNFQTATCENGAEAPGRDETVQGTSLLARRGASDFVLLEVTEAIPAAYGAYMNGFDATTGNFFDEPYTISHPSGDVKKIGIFGGQAVPEGYFQAGDTHWYVAAWDEGMTEGGSSGSPVFDDKYHIRGQLHGGFASCSYPYVDYYGRTFISWDQGAGAEQNLETHLDPTGTGTRVVDGEFLSTLKAKATATLA